MRFNKIISVSVASLLACTIVPFSECVRTDSAVYATDTADVASNTLSLGDVNSDGLVDAVDATLVLTEYALLSTGSESSFSEQQTAVADVNSDGLVDAVDATFILGYYSYLSTGGTMSFESYNIYMNSSSKDVYSAYLSQQNLCKISRNFKITEPGTATDNPNGLAGVVKHDFDGDGIDELVTFTFDKNSTDGEDIRVDLLKVSDDELVVADSRYITELADISSQPKDNTIYFDYAATTEIVTSEYNGNLYFGCLFSEVIDEFNRGGDSFGGFGIFTIENDKITKQTAGYDMAYVTSDEVCVSLLPPSIRNTEISDDFINDDGNIIAFMSDNFSQVPKGLYKSAEEARSAMTNEFGLDIEAKTDYYTYNIPDYHWASVDDSNIRTILNTEYILSNTSEMLTLENCYAGINLILGSDLETILDNNSPFTEPFADELALYEDILRYPEYHHEVWDTYADLQKEHSEIVTNYCVADINRDGRYEMVITSYIHTKAALLNASVVMPDSTVINIKTFGNTHFLDNGIVSVEEYNSKTSVIHYYDINTGTSWTAEDVQQEDSSYIRSLVQDNGDIRLEGAEAESKEQEFSAGNLLTLQETGHKLWASDSISFFRDFVIVEDINEITNTWQKAYINQIEENNFKDEMDYALLYLNDDNVPELIVGDPHDKRCGGIYTYVDNNVTKLLNLTLRYCIDGYIENEGVVGIQHWWDPSGERGYDIFKIESDNITKTEAFLDKYTSGESVYTINDTEVTESVYNETYASRSAEFAEVTYCTYDEIIAKLNENP